VKIIKDETRLAYIHLVKWVILALLSGLLGILVVHSFAFVIGTTNKIGKTTHLPIFILPVMGALLNGIVFYKIEPRARGEGIPSYIKSLKSEGGKFSLRVTIFKYLAALATLASYGNGGIVGPVGRVTAGVVSAFAQRVKRIRIARIKKSKKTHHLLPETTIKLFAKEDIRTAAICGMAAAMGTIFHTPIGGGIFAVEIIQKDKMNYRDLFPALLASTSAVFFSKSFNLRSFYTFNVTRDFMNMNMIGWIFLLSILGGLAGGFYTWIYSTIARLLKRESGSILIKVLTGSLIAGLLAWIVNPELAGTSSGLMSAILSRDTSILYGNIPHTIPLYIALLVLFLLKALGNTVTVGSGMSAGFTGPAAIMGMLLGLGLSDFLGVDMNSATHFAFIATGFSSVLASSMNIPIAAAVMSVEIFGLHYSLPATMGAVIGFQITRTRTIYEYAVKEIEEETKGESLLTDSP